jgi:hypothetical protein
MISGPAMALPGIVLGFVLLVFGRRMFWLFVGIAGFLFGVEIASTVLFDQPFWQQVTLALGFGLLGLLLALVAQRVAFVLVGIYGGAYLVVVLARTAGVQVEPLWLAIVGALGGGILAALLTDWVIIVLSSLVGAGAIVAGISVGPLVDMVIFVVLVVFGVSVQSSATKPK